MSSVAATPERTVEIGEVAGVAPDLVGVVHDHGGQLKVRVGVDGSNRRTSDVAGAPHGSTNLVTHGANLERVAVLGKGQTV